MKVHAKSTGLYKGVSYMQGNVFDIDEKDFDGSWMQKAVPINFSGTIPAFITPLKGGSNAKV